MGVDSVTLQKNHAFRTLRACHPIRRFDTTGPECSHLAPRDEHPLAEREDYFIAAVF